MATSRECEIPELFPQPKSIQLCEGLSELSFNVRLDTSNVFPIQRKAVRTILAAAGIRVIANKKKYVVRAKVEELSAFNFKDVPENAYRDYYELKIRGSEVAFRSPYQEGMVWAAQTLAELFKVVIAGQKLPNLDIRDWPETPIRGLFTDCVWGTDRMALNDWYQAIDIASSFKLNVMGVGIYNGNSADRFDADHKPYECLMVPLGQQDEEGSFVDELDMKTEHHIRWFNVQADMWRDETYVPDIQQQNFFHEVVVYGHERGVTVMPSFQVLGKSLLFPKKHPELSALDADGKPTGVGYCFSSPEMKTYFEKIFDRIMERYFDNELKFFQLRFDDDEFEQTCVEDVSIKAALHCQCAKCTGQNDSDLWMNFAVWLTKLLIKLGTQKVVFSGNQLLKPEMNKAFFALLKKEDLLSKAIFYPMGHIDFTKKCEVAGVETWLAPHACSSVYKSYQNNIGNIKQALLTAEKEKYTGVVAESLADSSHIDHLALLGIATWEGKALAKDENKILKEWAQSQFGASADAYLDSVKKLTSVVENPVWECCNPHSYCCIKDTKQSFSLEYPGVALKLLCENFGKENAVKELSDCMKQVEMVVSEMDKMGADEDLPASIKDCLDSFREESAVITVWAEIFSELMVIYSAHLNGKIEKGAADKCQELRAKLLGVMDSYQKNKASWRVPWAMQPASEMMLFLKNLVDDINAGAQEIRWCLPKDWKTPED